MADLFAAIEQIAISRPIAVSVIGDVLSVSRSGSHAWQTRGLSARVERDEELMPIIRDIFWTHQRRYGARPIAVELASRGEPCGVARVSKRLETQVLRAIQPTTFGPRTTNARHRLGDSPSRLRERDAPQWINAVWVGDITCIPLHGGRSGYLSLSLLMDLYSRRVVGWEYRESMTDALVLSSLRKAIRERHPARDLVHHNDRGGQYTLHAYRAVLRRASIQQTMSDADNCYDNAFMESCFGTLNLLRDVEKGNVN